MIETGKAYIATLTIKTAIGVKSDTQLINFFSYYDLKLKTTNQDFWDKKVSDILISNLDESCAGLITPHFPSISKPKSDTLFC